MMTMRMGMASAGLKYTWPSSAFSAPQPERPHLFCKCLTLASKMFLWLRMGR